MTLLEGMQLASVIVSPLFAAGGAYGAVKARLDALHERCTDNREDIGKVRDDVGRVHARIDALTACQSGR